MVLSREQKARLRLIMDDFMEDVEVWAEGDTRANDGFSLELIDLYRYIGERVSGALAKPLWQVYREQRAALAMAEQLEEEELFDGQSVKVCPKHQTPRNSRYRCNACSAEKRRESYIRAPVSTCRHGIEKRSTARWAAKCSRCQTLRRKEWARVQQTST